MRMKTYYSLLCSSPKQSFVRSIAEPFFVLCCIGVICAVLTLAGVSAQSAGHNLALAHSQTR